MIRLIIILLLLHSTIPFVSQEGEGADKYINDCGPAVVSMLIEHYSGEGTTPDSLMDLVGYDGYTTTAQLSWFLSEWGIESETVDLQSIDDVINNAPVIILVDLRTLYGDQYGRHWVLVTGEFRGLVRYHDPMYGPDTLMTKEKLQYARSVTRWPEIAMVFPAPETNGVMAEW